MQRLHVGRNRLLGVERRTVTTAFHERDARYHRVAMQIIERIDHRLLHQSVDHQAMLVGVDFGFAATSNHEMQAIRCDRAVEEMVWRPRRAAAGFELRIA